MSTPGVVQDLLERHPRLAVELSRYAGTVADDRPAVPVGAPWKSFRFPIEEGRVLHCSADTVFVVHEGWSARSRAALEAAPPHLDAEQWKATVLHTRGLRDWSMAYAMGDERWRVAGGIGDGKTMMDVLTWRRHVLAVVMEQDGDRVFTLLKLETR